MPDTLRISSPDGRLTLEFNQAGETLRFFEKLPDGETIDYFHRPAGNRNPMMHPWCNRVKGGVFSFNGETHLLRPLHGAENNALHGNWLSPWSVSEQGDHHVVLDIRCKAEDSADRKTPYDYAARQILTLDNEGLNIEMSLTNRGQTLPFGLGLHPFLPRPQDTILKVAVDRMENCGADMIPDKAQPIVAVPENWTLAEGFNISNKNLSPAGRGFGHADLMDNCFPGVDAQKGATITWPGFGAEGREMTVTASPNCRFAVCFVPGEGNDSAPGELSYFCFELTTNGIDMQNRLGKDTGAAILAKDEELRASTRFSVGRPLNI